MQLDDMRATRGASRRSFIGGSDARIIMGDDEAALLRLWRENGARFSQRTCQEILLSSSVTPPKT